jgi:hypothetical protein
VTIEDIVEEIIGEILAESETVPIRWLDDDTAVVRGDLNVHAVNEAHGIDLPDDGGFETVAGLVFDRTGRLVEEGESITEDGVGLVSGLPRTTASWRSASNCRAGSRSSRTTTSSYSPRSSSRFAERSAVARTRTRRDGPAHYVARACDSSARVRRGNETSRERLSFADGTAHWTSPRK